MKFKSLLLAGLGLFLMLSCDKPAEENSAESELTANEGFTATSFTATVTIKFNGLSSDERNYGSFGLLLTKSDDAETLFNAWKNGDQTVLNSIIVTRPKNPKVDGRLTVSVDGLDSETEYSYCGYYINEEGSERTIGNIDKFTTKPFSISVRNDGPDQVNFYSATLTGSLADFDDADGSGITYGFVYSSKTDTPTRENREGISEYSRNVSKQQFKCSFDHMNLGTKYYCRPFACEKNSGKCVYGETRSFTTKSADEMGIDLGLSVIWSQYMLGAETIGGVGDYYRWGENFSIKPNNAYALYDPHEDSGIKDIGKDNICGDPQYDPVTAKLGGKWRMPTADEVRELIKFCKFDVEPRNDRDYYSDAFLVAQSIHNGKKISFPATGEYYPYNSNGSGAVYEFMEYGLMYYYTGSMEVTTDTYSDYFVVAGKEDELNAYLDAHGGSAYISDLLTLGLIEERWETYTGKYVNYFTINELMANYDYYYSQDDHPEMPEGFKLKINTLYGGDNGFCVWPVRDKD